MIDCTYQATSTAVIINGHPYKKIKTFINWSTPNQD